MIAAYKIFNKIKIGGLILSGSTIFIMMLFIVADVALRNMLNSSVLGSYEITEYLLMPLAFFPGLAFAYSSGIMPRVEMFVVKLKIGHQRNIFIALLILEMILFLLLTFYGFQYALTGTEEILGFSMKGTIIPYYPILYFVPLGFLLLSIEIFFLIIKNFQSEKPTLNFKE
ncbi:TRAP transporter small permease [Oceanobacillus salinisoli]|uniref:TRAP transporter small permease n=1 Tax=Oceanobacillus salinisoli TaxID=2678611 RepID=UPI0012E2E050|nr:TRAP transporter small permease [Oceanobacillus salinisoli]